MAGIGTLETVDLQGLRVKLYDVMGHSYSAVSPSPASLMLLQATDMIYSPTGLFRGRGRIRGVGFDGKRFSVQELRANDGDGDLDDEDGFDGLIVSVSHALPIYGRAIVLPDRGLLNPRHVDGMKRVGFPARQFEKAYEVYADDQVEGRALIPPDFVERLMDFNPILSTGRARVAFAGRQMHVVLPTGDLMRFSEDVPVHNYETAAEIITAEMIRVFDLVARVDALHSSADRHCPIERERARADFYLSTTQSVGPMVQAAMKAGIVENPRQAKYLTRDAMVLDPAFQGLLMPRV
ncbi:MAG: DUF3137 domain-containing protein [Pseudomonadota bacterium]